MKKTRKKLCLLSLISIISVISPSCSKKPVTEETDQWKITLDFQDNSSRPATLYVNKTESVTLPVDAYTNGKAFKGWSLTKDGAVIDNTYTPSADTTLYAVWTDSVCNVTFRSDAADGETKTVEVPFGTTIDATALPTLTKTGYTLQGWATIPVSESPVDFTSYTINGDYTFYAIWRSAAINDYTVLVKPGTYTGAAKDTSKKVESGKTIKSTDSIWKFTRDGYDLSGFTTKVPESGSWTIDDYANKDKLVKEIGIEYTTVGNTKAYKPSSDVTLYAVWTIKQLKAVWSVNYTDATSSNVTKNYLSNQVVSEEAAPTREGYTFAGWYASQYGLTDKVEFTDQTKLKVNTVYYAHWKSNPVETKIFDAEYCPIDPNSIYYGYSGSVNGCRCITKVPNEELKGDYANIHVDKFPLNSVLKENYGNYVTYQYEKGNTLRFEINSSKATTAKLLGNCNIEDERAADIASTGSNAVRIVVNGVDITYSVKMEKAFKEIDFGTINLKEGLNVIEIIVNNDNKMLGGTYKAVGFNTDYIRLDTDATLTWSPIYDNLEAAL